jgi:DNA anti-recombination protein RmuC
MVRHGVDKNVYISYHDIQMIQDQIRKMRITINSHLDKLEQDILQELDDTADKLKSKIYKLLKQLSKNSKTVEGLQSVLHNNHKLCLLSFP